MSNIKHLLINVENLTDEEQLNLWMTLLAWSDTEIPNNKTLVIGVIKK